MKCFEIMSVAHLVSVVVDWFADDFGETNSSHLPGDSGKYLFEFSAFMK
jgi:hypothetical protein